MLNGPDGVPTVMVPGERGAGGGGGVEGGGEGEGGCTLEVVGGNDWPHTPLHAGLWLSEEAWSSDGQPKLYDHSKSGAHNPGNAPQVVRLRGAAASLLGFSSSAFYHFVMEALPRLALLLPTLRRFPATALVVPRHRPGGFIDQLLRLSLPTAWLAPYTPPATARGGQGGPGGQDGGAKGRRRGGRLIQYDTAAASAPGPRLEATQLLWADWPRVSDRTTGAPIHCVAPQSALRAAAAMVKRGWRRRRARAANKTSWAAEADVDAEAATPCVVWARRGGKVKMRQLPAETEERLITRLRAAAARANVDFVDFDGGSSSVEEAVALYARASAVVGLHGGQLANTLFCTDGTLLVELAFASPFTSHYAHAAAALGLAYKAVELEPDERGVGAHALRLSDDAVDAVVARVEKHLKFAKSHHPLHDEL